MNDETEEPFKYEKDGKKIQCWFCEGDGEEYSQSGHLIAVRVFESDRYLCIKHLLRQLLNEFTKFTEKANR